MESGGMRFPPCPQSVGHGGCGQATRPTVIATDASGGQRLSAQSVVNLHIQMDRKEK